MAAIATGVVRPGQLTPIADPPMVARALALLARGFPERDDAFWRRGFARIEALRAAGHLAGPDGYVLESPEGDAGVILTLRRSRGGDDGQGELPICNLSSWSVEPAHRSLAPLMLRQVLKAEEGCAVVTDLTPSAIVETLNAKLGLTPWSDGTIIAFALPFAAMPRRRGYRIFAYDAGSRTMLDAGQRVIAERHLELGCIAAVIETPEGASPLILRAIRRRGLEVGQVIFAASRAAVIRALPSLMRFLIRRGMPVAWIDAPAGLCPAGAHFRAGQKRFHTGGLPADRLDYAYSEFVIFGV